MIWIWIVLGISLGYVLLILCYLYGWFKTPVSVLPLEHTFHEGVTIIIIAHNEEKTIGNCLSGILHQNYPKHLVEIIVVDDHSTDSTIAEVGKIEDDRIHLLWLRDHPHFIHPPAYKKSGITLAVDQAQHDMIVLTDADVEHPPEWLRSVIYPFHQRNAVFQTAPVMLIERESMLEKMQEMEQQVLMVITAAGYSLRWHEIANGANLVFRKDAFMKVKGYEGNYHFASGDDMFLAERMAKAFPDRISFVKSNDACVFTGGKKDWNSLLAQRLRWAGKNKGLEKKTIQRVWYFVGACSFMITVIFFLALFHWVSWWLLLGAILIKWIADFSIVASASVFFRRERILSSFIPLQILYNYYILRLAWAMMTGKNKDWRS